MDPEIVDNFFVTLPSNSSFQYFPNNTQSSFRTKLSSPLVLNGNWEVGLSEVFLPRNWFNVNKDNNAYSVVYETEELLTKKQLEYRIQFDYEKEEDRHGYCKIVNEAIKKEMGAESDAVVFSADETEANVSIHVKEGYALNIKPKGGRKFLYMLRLPIEDIVLTGKNTYKYRPSTTVPLNLSFTITNNNAKSDFEHMLPVTSIKDDMPMNTVTDLINIFRHNLKLLELEHFVNFNFAPAKSELTITVAENAEIVLSEKECPSLLEKLNLKETTIVRNMQKFSIDPLKEVKMGEAMKLRIFEYYETKVNNIRRIDLTLSVGMYKTPRELFEAFEYVHLSQSPDLRVNMKVPVAHEVTFSRGLADMLGFKNTTFKSGIYVSEYPLELDGGITEIFIYSDLISSHHCGDFFLPLLRIVPCMGEKGDQIVKNYQRPLYFSLRNNFIETIQIELKSSAGNDIIFSGGKTYVILSFRRRKV